MTVCNFWDDDEVIVMETREFCKKDDLFFSSADEIFDQIDTQNPLHFNTTYFNSASPAFLFLDDNVLTSMDCCLPHRTERS